MYLCAMQCFRLRNKEAVKPELYPPIDEWIDPTVASDGRITIGGRTLRKNIDLVPQKGIQEQMCHLEVNLVFAVGSATMGKTFGGMMTGLQGVDKHNYSGYIVSKVSKDMGKGSSMYRDFKFITGFGGVEFVGTDSPTAYWKGHNATLQTLHLNYNTNNPKEYDDFKESVKKTQGSYFYYDEITAIDDERVFWYLFSRNRDESGMIPRTIASFNPTKNHFTFDILLSGGYIDTTGTHPRLKKDMIGKIRYFYQTGNYSKDLIWGYTREEVVAKANISVSEAESELGLSALDMVKSFTVLSGEAATNKVLVRATGGGSIANLHASGEKERKALLEGYFIDRFDHEGLNVTPIMVEEAFGIEDYDDGVMRAAMDISANKLESDGSPFVVLRGKTVVAIEECTCPLDELPKWVDRKLKHYGVDPENFAFDSNGVGLFMSAFNNGYPIFSQGSTLPIVDDAGNTVKSECYNLRSQLLDQLAKMYITGELRFGVDRGMMCKYGKGQRSLIEIIKEDIDVFRYVKKSNNKIYYQSKDEFKARHAKRSPDITDALSYLMIFFIQKREKKKPPEVYKRCNYISGLYGGIQTNNYNRWRR